MSNKTAERLAALRGKTAQSRIAEIAGVSASTISNWEAGISYPPADAILRLARHYGVTADFIVGLTDHQQTLPPDCWIVDLDYVEAVRRGDGSHAKMHEGGAAAIPRRWRILTSSEYQALERELRPMLSSTVKRKRGSQQ
jgi:transcriptional regulator with XRE-family HTH domain